MTKANSSHITLVVDRTGSMAPIRDDAEGAVNTFISTQAKEPGECSLLLVEFDAPGSDLAGGDPWYNVVHDGDIQDSPLYSLRPRGWTALYDAIGTAITGTGERLAALKESERPAHVFFVVQTDGAENSSKDWALGKLVDSIKVQESKFSWTFIFLGAGPAAWGAANAFVGTGLHKNATRSGVTGQSLASAYNTTSLDIAAARSGQNVSYGHDVDDEGNVS